MTLRPSETIFIWDIDGTLYRPQDGLHTSIRSAEIRTIADHLSVPYTEASRMFYEVYKKVTPSGTQAAAEISGITVSEAARYMDTLYDRTKYLCHDEELVRVFERLRSARHFVLSNGGKAGIVKMLNDIGLGSRRFEEIVTSEVVGENKPGLAGFRYILAVTGRDPGVHIMVGDREEVDIKPAHACGMRSVLVWAGQGVTTEATYIAETVYHVPETVFGARIFRGL